MPGGFKSHMDGVPRAGRVVESDEGAIVDPLIIGPLAVVYILKPDPEFVVPAYRQRNPLARKTKTLAGGWPSTTLIVMGK